MHSTTRISIYSVVFEIEAKQVCTCNSIFEYIVLIWKTVANKSNCHCCDCELILILVAQMENDTKIKVRNYLSNATLSIIWSTLFFQHFPWIMLIFGPLNQRCSRKSQHCSNFLEQWKFPWAMLIFYWTTLI